MLQKIGCKGQEASTRSMLDVGRGGVGCVWGRGLRLFQGCLYLAEKRRQHTKDCALKATVIQYARKTELIVKDRRLVCL